MLLAAIPRIQRPRGIRNDNPGNIRLTNTQWRGMRDVQTDDAFVQFTSPEYGFRAMVRVLRSYERRGLNTVREIISTYAPASENHTENYVNFLAERLDVSPEAPIDVDAVMLPLIKAITIFENGPLYADHYSEATIKEGIALA